MTDKRPKKRTNQDFARMPNLENASPVERLSKHGLLVLTGRGHAEADSLTVRIYRNLRESLLGGVLSPGDMLNTRPFASAFGVSTMPVREAMSRLVADGGLEPLANRAFRVPRIKLAQFRELFLMRLRLETLAAEHAAVHVAAADLKAIRAALDAMSATRSPALSAYLLAHRDFHFGIYGAARMPLLYNAIETLWLRMGPIMNAAAALYDFDEEHRAHSELLSALRRADAPAASKAVEEDLRLASERTSRFIEVVGENGASTTAQDQEAVAKTIGRFSSSPI